MRELKVALIGGGFMGKAHSLAMTVAPQLENIGATITKQVLVEVDPDLASSLAEDLGYRFSETDWRAAIARDDVDIVDICTPPQLHEEIALAAIAAGKHVFCEKPITNVSSQGFAMRDAAEAAGVITQVGYNYRHTPAVEFAKQLLDRGDFGVPLQFRASFLQDGLFTLVADPHRWRASRGTGGSGMVGDIGSHIIDSAEYLFGDIVRVAARVRTKAPDAGWIPESERLAGDALEDAGVWIAEFANGAIGTFAINSYASGRKNRFAFEFDASKAAVEFNWNDREVFKVSYVGEDRDHLGFRTIHTNAEHPDSFWRLAGLGTGYTEVSAIQFRKFIKAIVAGTPAKPDFGDAARVQQIVEAVVEAAAGDVWVEVPRR
jgi:predicted dehydrogenase